MFAVAFSPDGQSILTGSWDKTAILWDLTGTELQKFQGHTSEVNAVAFSPDGQSILTGSMDNTATLWDLTGTELQKFQGHTLAVSAVAFSPDGQSILTGSWDKTAILWDLNETELQKNQGHTSEVNAVAFSPDGQSILTGSRDNTAILWDLTGTELQKIQGHTSEVSAVAFSPDGQSILTGSRDKTAILWDLTGTELQKFQGHTSEVSAVAFSPDGQSILTGSWDKTAILWDLTGTELQKNQGHTESVNAVAFSPDGQSILTGSWDKTAILWDLTGTELQKFQGHTLAVFAVAFSPDGQSILTGSRDNTTILWDLTGTELQKFQGHTWSVSAVAFSPDGQSILTGSRDKTSILWLNPFTILAKKVEIYSKGKLKAVGLEFTEEDWKCKKKGQQVLVYDFDLSLKSSNAIQLTLAGTYFYDKKDWEKARQLYEKSLEKYFRFHLLFELYEIAKWQQKSFNFQRFLDLEDGNELKVAGDYFYKKEDWEKAKQLYEKANKKELHATAQIKLYEIAEKQGKPLGVDYFLQNQSVVTFKTIIDYFRPKNSDVKRKKEYLQKYVLIYPLMNHAIALGTDSTHYGQFVTDANQYAYFQFLNEDFIGAEKSARRGLELDSTNVFLHLKIAPALLFQGQYGRAKVEFEKWAAKPFNNDFPNYAAKYLDYFALFEKEKIIPEEHRAKMEEIKAYLQQVVKEQKTN